LWARRLSYQPMADAKVCGTVVQDLLGVDPVEFTGQLKPELGDLLHLFFDALLPGTWPRARSARRTASRTWQERHCGRSLRLKSEAGQQARQRGIEQRVGQDSQYSTDDCLGCFARARELGYNDRDGGANETVSHKLRARCG
jgi:hypothetical protein